MSCRGPLYASVQTNQACYSGELFTSKLLMSQACKQRRTCKRARTRDQRNVKRNVTRIQGTSHLHLRRLAAIFNGSECNSVCGTNILWDRTHKQSLREHCIDVKFL